MSGERVFFVIDCESVGLQGETFDVGYVVVDRRGRELEAGRCGCDPYRAESNKDLDGRAWVQSNVPPPADGYREVTPRDVRARLWHAWLRWERSGAILCADVAWPVEARFLLDAVDDDVTVRRWQGPYPLIDAASVRFAAGLDPLAKEPRRPNELPEHDPLADARQSARLLVEALDRIEGRRT